MFAYKEDSSRVFYMFQSHAGGCLIGHPHVCVCVAVRLGVIEDDYFAVTEFSTGAPRIQYRSPLSRLCPPTSHSELQKNELTVLPPEIFDSLPRLQNL